MPHACDRGEVGCFGCAAKDAEVERLKAELKEARVGVQNLADKGVELEDDNRALREREIHLRLSLTHITTDVAKMWKAVQDGLYGSRSLVGDTTLSLAEQLKEHGLGPLAESVKEAATKPADSGAEPCQHRKPWKYDEPVDYCTRFNAKTNEQGCRNCVVTDKTPEGTGEDEAAE